MEIATLSGLLGVGNPKKKKKSKKKRSKKRKASKKKKTKSKTKTVTKTRTVYRNPKGSRIIKAVGAFLAAIAVGGLSGAGIREVWDKVLPRLYAKFPTIDWSGLPGYAAKAGVGIGAVLLLKKFLGAKAAAGVATAAATLIGVQIYDSHIRPKLAGLLPGGSSPATNAATAGVGAVRPRADASVQGLGGGTAGAWGW